MWHRSNILKRQKNKNYIQDEIKRRLHSGNSCYHLDQKRLSSPLLYNNVKNKVYKTTSPAIFLIRV
jgi:hypothetical protein